MQSPKPASRKRCKSRRTFLKAAGLGTLATGLPFMNTSKTQAAETLAMNGGKKAVTAGGASRWPLYGEAEEKAVLNIVRSPGYGNLPQLEEDWRTKFGAKYAKSHCNGTGAITAMFFALTKDLPPGSEIMVPSYTFFATIVPMRLFGYVPVFVDINPQTLNFDLNDAKKKLTPNTKAMIPVHWIGLPCDMDQICDFAKEKGLIVLEDACHAQGCQVAGQIHGNVGTHGRVQLPGLESPAGDRRRHGHLSRERRFRPRHRLRPLREVRRQVLQIRRNRSRCQAADASYGRGLVARPDSHSL